MVENEIVTRFHKNIDYLQKQHPKVYENLAALDGAIAKGYYQEKYELVLEEGGFDVYEKDTNTFLYAKKSSEHTKLAAKSIDYKINENAFQTFQDKQVENRNNNIIDGISPLLSYIKERTSPEKTLLSIDKFIFFGVGLGLHIEAIHMQIGAQVYLIVEDDLELFRLSLFTTNYADIAQQAQIFFSVFEDKNEYLKTSEEFLEKKFYYNHYLKFFHILSHKENKLEEFPIAIASQSHLSFYYNTLLVQSLKPLEYIAHEYKFLNKGVCFNDSLLSQRKFLFLGAGPSLQKNIQWLKNNKHNFIIVAVAAVLEYLESEKIVPAIVIHLDAHETSRELFSKIKDMNFFQKSIFFLSAKIPLNIVDLLPKTNIFLFENGTRYKKYSLKPAAPCVGSIGYQILLYLQVKNLYLLGLDLSLDTNSLKTHIDTYTDVKVINMEEQVKNSYTQDFYKLEGNFSEYVYTNRRWNQSVDSINQSSDIFKKQDTRVINLSDGVKFANMESQSTQELLFDGEEDLNVNKYLLSLCNQTALVELTTDEREVLKYQLEYAEQLLSIVRENNDDFIEKIKRLYTSNEQAYEISKVVQTYLRSTASYVVFDSSKEMQRIFFKGLEDILLYYIKEYKLLEIN